MSWNDFNDAPDQTDRDIIPARTKVKVHMKIRPGGYDDPSQGWTGGYARRNEASGAVMLDCEFTVMGGPYDKRKIWSCIGLYSPKEGNAWGIQGKSFIKAALESARGFKPGDQSDAARAARRIGSLADLNGLTFAAIVGVDKEPAGSSYSDKNRIDQVLPCTHADYAAVMSGTSAVGPSATAPGTSTAVPSWAQ